MALSTKLSAFFLSTLIIQTYPPESGKEKEKEKGLYFNIFYFY
jgi:hypothetical protein